MAVWVTVEDADLERMRQSRRADVDNEYAVICGHPQAKLLGLLFYIAAGGQIDGVTSENCNEMLERWTRDEVGWERDEVWAVFPIPLDILEGFLNGDGENLPYGGATADLDDLLKPPKPGHFRAFAVMKPDTDDEDDFNVHITEVSL